MDRERGDEIPFGEPPNPYRRNPPGLKSRFTAAEIQRMRDVYDQWREARIARVRVCKELGVRSDLFNRIGQGKCGKNPRA